MTPSSLHPTLAQLIADNRLAEVVVQTAPFIVLVLDNDGHVVTFNRYMETLSGYTAEEAAGWNWFARFLPQRDRTRIAEIFDDCKAGNHVKGNVNPIVTRWGEERLIEWYDDHIRGQDGAPVGIVAIGFDITDKAAAMAQLAEREQLVTALMESHQVGMMLVRTATMQVVLVNRAMADMVGMPQEEIVGRPCHRFLCLALDGHCPLLVGNKTVENVARDMTRADGTTIPVLKSVSRLQLNGELHLLETFVDMSEQRRLELELQYANKMHSMGQLAAAVAHEINTPAQYVADNVQFALTELPHLLGLLRQTQDMLACTDPATREERAAALATAIEEADLEFAAEELPQALEQARDGVARIAGIVSGLRTLADSGEERKGSVDLNEIIRQAIVVSRDCWEQVAVVHTDLDPELPPFQGYAGDLHQAVLHLLMNAADAIACKRATVGDDWTGEIHVATARDGDHVVIAVSDNGTGIPDNIKTKIFDPFFSTKKSSTSAPGGSLSGQGGSIIFRVVVDKHGGSVDFDTHEGEGTTFVLNLPL